MLNVPSQIYLENLVKEAHFKMLPKEKGFAVGQSMLKGNEGLKGEFIENLLLGDFSCLCFLSQNTDLLEISKDGKGHTETIHKLMYVFV